MKRYKKNIQILNRILIFFFAAFITLFVIFNQSIQQKIVNHTVETIPAQEGDDETPGAQYSFVSSAAVTPFFSLGIAAASFIILNYSVENDNYVKHLDTSTFYINKYLEILFSRIISPNAP